MKTTRIILSALAIMLSLTTFSQTSGKLVSEKTNIRFFSHTTVEDIQATNNTSVSTLNKETGEVVFSVPMQGFEFEKALMQEHYNGKDFLDTKTHPKSKLKGKITNLDAVNFAKDGVYPAVVEGEMTIKGVTKPIVANGTITVTGNKAEVNSKFDITLADYEINFKKGKPSTNIAKTLEITVLADYQPE
jgi:polyisoprenoid-binding protein YceI